MPYTWTATLWYPDITPVDHETVGQARLIWKYRGEQPRIQAFLAALLEQLQSMENVSFDVLTGIWPLTAIGDQLDVIGKIILQPRLGLTDAEYRLYILCRIRANKSNGRIEDITDIFDILSVTGAHIDEYYPGEFVVSIVGEQYGVIIGDIIGDVSAGGVLLSWLWSEYDEDETFAMGDTLGADETNATGGFGDLTGATQTTGGYFSGGFYR